MKVKQILLNYLLHGDKNTVKTVCHYNQEAAGAIIEVLVLEFIKHVYQGILLASRLLCQHASLYVKRIFFVYLRFMLIIMPNIILNMVSHFSSNLQRKHNKQSSSFVFVVT